jgi:hypothetical protein
MGDIADMMISGVLCQVCGVYLGEEQGYPITYDGCKKDEEENSNE